MNSFQILQIIGLARQGPTGLDRPADVLRKRMEQELVELREAVEAGDREGVALELADVAYYAALYASKVAGAIDIEGQLGDYCQRVRDALGVDPLDDMDWWAVRFALAKYRARFIENECRKDDAAERQAICSVLP